MPTPKEWPHRDRLVRDLSKYKWKEWFNSEREKESVSELQTIIKDAVGANTFRAFKCRQANKPSVTFREWANRYLDRKTLAKLWSVKSQHEYDEWLGKLVISFTRHWNSKMRKAAFGPYFKLPNLLVKRLCLHREVRRRDFSRVVWYLHVPLDSYTIVAVKNCVESFPHPNAIGRVPKTSTMSFVKNQKMYNAFQSGIREMAHQAGVPPITLDCLAWDSGH
jgi:hypothetical protein